MEKIINELDNEFNDRDLLEYEQSEENDLTKVLNRFTINSYTIERPVEVLYKWLKRDKLIIPEFQRDYVWSKKVASKFIDSILLGLPIPNIFVFKLYREDGSEYYQVIDGFQRLTSLKHFKEGSWSENSGLKPGDEILKKSKFNVLYEGSKWNGLTYDSLSQDDRDFLDEYSIQITIFETLDPKDLDSIFLVFERINTGSEKLSEQEIRNAAYQGECLEKLKALAKEDVNYLELLENDSKIFSRQRYIETFLRFATYYQIYQQTQQGSKELIDSSGVSISKSKVEMMNEFLKLGNASKIKYEDIFSKVEDAIRTIKDWDVTAFKTMKRTNIEQVSKSTHEVFAEALVISIIESGYKVGIASEEFLKLKSELWKSQEFYDMFSSNTTDSNTVQKRVQFMIKVLKGDKVNLEPRNISNR